MGEIKDAGEVLYNPPGFRACGGSNGFDESRDLALAKEILEAREVLHANAVVTSEREYTKDAAVYRQWRDDVASMIVGLMSADIIERDLETDSDAGDLRQPLASQLSNHLDQAVRHHESGREEAAIESLELFVEHLNNADMAAYVTAKVTARPNQDVHLLIASWS